MSGFVGVGLRPTHYPFLEETLKNSLPIRSQWFEAISENYMDTRGRPLSLLLSVRANFPVALHGVSLSIASTDGLNMTYLERLKALIERVDPFVISDHLCWTGAHGKNYHDLLPIKFSKENLDHISSR